MNYFPILFLMSEVVLIVLCEFVLYSIRIDEPDFTLHFPRKFVHLHNLPN